MSTDERETIVFRPIGVVRSPFTAQPGTPIQPRLSDAVGTIELDPELAPALADLAGFERIWVLFVAHRAKPYELTLVPYRDDRTRGLFATRSPARPNPIGISAVRLERVEGAVLHVSELDILDGSPVLDLKPYVPEFDAYPDARAGWLDGTAARRGRADHRFADQE